MKGNEDGEIESVYGVASGTFRLSLHVYVMYFTAVHCVCLGGRVVACVCAGGSGTSQRVIGFEAVLVVLSACVQDMCAFGWYVTAVHCGCV